MREMNLQKTGKKIIAAAILTTGVFGAAAFGGSETDAATSTTAQYNSYSKQVTTLVNQAKNLKSRSAAWSLYSKYKKLENRIDWRSDQAKYSGNYTMYRKWEQLENRLNYVENVLEYRWGVD